jgi:hypothetical protein
LGSEHDGQRSGLGGGGAGRGEDGDDRAGGEEGLTGRLRRGEAFTRGGAVDF